MQKDKPTEEQTRRESLISYFQALEKNIPEDEMDRNWEGLMRRLEQKPARGRTLRMYVRAACAAALVAGVVWGVFGGRNGQERAMQQAIAVIDGQEADSLQDVLLITHAGQRIAVDKKSLIRYSESGDATVDEKQVENRPQEVEYNQLIVPRGKSSRLLLADGTSLYVNAGTKVVYPSVFTGKKREIYVDGEIYIDVKKDTERPFIVKTSDFDVRVMGTAFNVNAYKHMKEAEVVLLRGAIVVKDRNDKETAVSPSELLDLSGGVARSKRTVCAEEYVAWIDGRFPLQGRSMEQILQRLSNYYGCEIRCDASIKDLALRGTIDLTVPLAKVFERIAKIHPVTVRQTGDAYELTINPNMNP